MDLAKYVSFVLNPTFFNALTDDKARLVLNDLAARCKSEPESESESESDSGSDREPVPDDVALEFSKLKHPTKEQVEAFAEKHGLNPKHLGIRNIRTRRS
jgi:hypothetical protein